MVVFWGAAEASEGEDYSEEVDHKKCVLEGYIRPPVPSVLFASSTKKHGRGSATLSYHDDGLPNS